MPTIAQVNAVSDLLWERNDPTTCIKINQSIQAAEVPDDLPHWVRDELLVCSRMVQHKDDQPRKAFDLIKWKQL